MRQLVHGNTRPCRPSLPLEVLVVHLVHPWCWRVCACGCVGIRIGELSIGVAVHVRVWARV